MSDDGFEIPRRKALGALGTIGVASAGAGLGTSAYFSDEETFENNQLTAGTLDMVVDWEEHYSDWMGEETDFARMPEEGEEPDFVLEAPTENGDDIELVFTETQQDFWDATAIEAFPDENDDALRDPLAEPCEELGSLPDVLGDDLRTENEFTSPDDPLISLQDVKPGDFGEVTLSFHLCDNPGFVWFGGDLVTNIDGENTEPELEDPDEPQNESTIGYDTPGELADEIQVRAWYDDGNNIYEPETPASCVYHLFDDSGTMEQNLNLGDGDPRDKEDVAQELGLDLTVYLDTIDDGGDDGTLADAPSSISYIRDGTFTSVIDNSTSETDLDNALDDVPNSGSGGITPQNIIDGLADAREQLIYDEETETGCQNENKVLIFYTNADSRPQDEADRQQIYDDAARLKDDGVTIKVVGFDVDVESNAEEFLTTIADEYYTIQPANSASGVDDQADAVQGDLQDNFAPAQLGEVEIYQGTLADFTDEYPFDPENGEFGVALEGDIPAEDGGGMGRNCFSATDTHYIGFEWWLPLDHANEVQGDIVEFDLGFYTEQCRHNDGTGLAPENNTSDNQSAS